MADDRRLSFAEEDLAAGPEGMLVDCGFSLVFGVLEGRGEDGVPPDFGPGGRATAHKFSRFLRLAA